MKTLIGMRASMLLLLSVLSAGLIIGCKKGSKKTADEEANKVTTERDYKNLRTVVDSTYSDWHIIIQEADTDVKIEGYDEFDKKVLVTISKMERCYSIKKSSRKLVYIILLTITSNCPMHISSKLAIQRYTYL